MSYSVVRSTTTNRFSEVQAFLNHLVTNEGDNTNRNVSLEYKVQKGLFYVHLYSALEKSVNVATETAIQLIMQNFVSGAHYITGIGPVILHPKLQGLKDSASKSYFKKSYEVFERAQLDMPVPVEDTIFSSNLQNVWPKTLDELLKCFGMPGFQLSQSESLALNEVVDKRNAVAHGRLSASSVGEGHNTEVLSQRYVTIRQVIIRFIDELEDYIDNKLFIDPSYRALY
nr:hypothetical protein BN993_04331 [Virgibacillus halodenitrificans]